jgi:hypothetical protein
VPQRSLKRCARVSPRRRARVSRTRPPSRPTSPPNAGPFCVTTIGLVEGPGDLRSFRGRGRETIARRGWVSENPARRRRVSENPGCLKTPTLSTPSTRPNHRPTHHREPCHHREALPNPLIYRTSTRLAASMWIVYTIKNQSRNNQCTHCRLRRSECGRSA